MKGLIILAIIIVLVGAGIWVGIMKVSLSDQGTWFLIAAGDAKGQTIDWVLSVDIGNTRGEQPRLDKQFNLMWDEWIDQHFEMRDAAGEKVPFTRIAHTLLVDERKVKHVPEFYILYKLEMGKPYTIDHIPKVATKKRYRYEFAAPTGTMEPKRVQLLPVEK